MEPQDLPERLRAFLLDVTTCSLATVDAEGTPHSANLYFAPDDALNLYFVSDPKSAHSRHVVGQPRVAGSVYLPTAMWQQIRGIQFHGRAEMIEDRDWDFVWETYLRKFPHILDVEEMVRSQTFYRVRPDWYRYIDNTVRLRI